LGFYYINQKSKPLRWPGFWAKPTVKTQACNPGQARLAKTQTHSIKPKPGIYRPDPALAVNCLKVFTIIFITLIWKDVTVNESIRK
jgi:hypothetical protein